MMSKNKSKILTVLVVFIICLLYNVFSFLKNGIWNFDSIIISIILIVCSIISSIMFK